MISKFPPISVCNQHGLNDFKLTDFYVFSSEKVGKLINKLFFIIYESFLRGWHCRSETHDFYLISTFNIAMGMRFFKPKIISKNVYKINLINNQFDCSRF